ncbi:MAG TPA: DNA alkylation repair protein [Patescibacteria group bacterium]|jgi:3-methyladenine DNA glycosylase AlkD|nr:DNA alkylation repair protein [Patescibacteria group bacterium]
MQNELIIIRNLLCSTVEKNFTNTKLFFKTSKGQYAEHDQFIGVSVIHIRSLAKQFKGLSLDLLSTLIQSAFNEERLLALFILILQYKKADTTEQKRLYDFYLHNIAYINNWNLVDSSAHLIVGAYVQNKDKSILSTLAQSPYWWHRRIAIVATWYFTKQGDTDHTFYIATLLLYDTHDLIHKAVGWMLRESGKKNKAQLIQFLDVHALYMPRTMVRYATEKFDQSLKQKYFLKKNV